MIRFILIIILFILSLVNFFPVPSQSTWYVGIAVPEFPWVFMLVSIALMIWSWYSKKLRMASLIVSVITFVILTSPIVRAYNVGSHLSEDLENSFGVKDDDMKGFHQEKPFSFLQMFTGNGAKDIPFKTYHFAKPAGVDLTLNFTPSAIPGVRPCLIVVHGGSWKRGDNSEIAAANNYFANAGYQVATINYRLAPKFPSPAQQEDLHSAMKWLRQNAKELKIDTTNFVLMGRSAGASIVLTMAYTGKESGVKGVAAFYGAINMPWSYKNPDNPLIMDSREVQRDFLGGTPEEVPERYIAESPLFHINSKTTSTLLAHGCLDAHVWHIQSEMMKKELDKHHVKNYLLTIPWGTHGFEYNLNGPAGQLSMYSVERFFYSVTQMKK
ncbi:Carboxylesterase NlhH [Chryseobacterium aquaeductus]|uniref:Carboxylesterase NlhH n=1 Tax=Chryseobacterium aquaeductus TaxID=2675056 RepID=A0A9N8MH68_9FLAO|nr:alpha/beta hydrolase [Chryseobacterium aquaeductus]CAA7331128.1 Carboxylesterase NlhH [Chryseobacterium potabilaquae]CAD7808347.1 Carboxylesterase NlhH [Chryseobacterium aquaeductus]